MYILLLVAAIFGVASAQITMPGQCDTTIAVVNNFDAAKYLGTWYEIYSHPQVYESGLTCVTARYSLATGGGVMVNNSGVRTEGTNKKWVVNIGNATILKEGEGKLEVQFPAINNAPPSPYWVLATNYDSYSVVYACRNANATYKFVSSWILSRTQNLLGKDLNFINTAIIRVTDLKWEQYNANDHTGEGCNGAGTQQLAVFMIIVSSLIAKFL